MAQLISEIKSESSSILFEYPEFCEHFDVTKQLLDFLGLGELTPFAIRELTYPVTLSCSEQFEKNGFHYIQVQIQDASGLTYTVEMESAFETFLSVFNEIQVLSNSLFWGEIKQYLKYIFAIKKLDPDMFLVFKQEWFLHLQGNNRSPQFLLRMADYPGTINGEQILYTLYRNQLNLAQNYERLRSLLAFQWPELSPEFEKIGEVGEKIDLLFNHFYPPSQLRDFSSNSPIPGSHLGSDIKLKPLPYLNKKIVKNLSYFCGGHKLNFNYSKEKNHLNPQRNSDFFHPFEIEKLNYLILLDRYFLKVEENFHPMDHQGNETLLVLKEKQNVLNWLVIFLNQSKSYRNHFENFSLDFYKESQLNIDWNPVHRFQIPNLELTNFINFLSDQDWETSMNRILGEEVTDWLKKIKDWSDSIKLSEKRNFNTFFYAQGVLAIWEG